MGNKSASYWVEHLGLKPHPEGGWFRESYRAAGSVNGRNFSTAIYFLLEGNQFSALHRIKSDEVWHFYTGDLLEISVLGQKTIELGPDNPQAVVLAGAWFGARLKNPDGYALVGCTVAPGFDFTDFEMGKRGDLLSKYPDQKDIISKLTADEQR